MVSCEEVQRLLDESLELELELSGEAEAHIECCSACREAREELSFLRGVLAEAEPAALPDDFELSLRRRLVSEDRQLRSRAPSGRATSRATWITASAIAVAAAVLLVVGALIKIGAPVAPPASTYHQLHLSVRCAEDLPDALFDVRLPQDVRLSPEVGTLGDGAQIRWRSRLRAGVNEIDIPLVSRRTSASVVVRLTASGKTVESRVRLSTSTARVGGKSRVTLALVVGGERRERGRP